MVVNVGDVNMLMLMLMLKLVSVGDIDNVGKCW